MKSLEEVRNVKWLTISEKGYACIKVGPIGKVGIGKWYKYGKPVRTVMMNNDDKVFLTTEKGVIVKVYPDSINIGPETFDAYRVVKLQRGDRVKDFIMCSDQMLSTLGKIKYEP